MSAVKNKKKETSSPRDERRRKKGERRDNGTTIEEVWSHESTSPNVGLKGGGLHV